MIAAMELLQGEPPCEFNGNLTKKFSSFTLSNITNIKVFLLPLLTSMIHNIKEDEKIINEHKAHMMPLVGVINQGHLFEEMLLIHAQEDPYIIQLHGQKNILTLFLMHL